MSAGSTCPPRSTAATCSRSPSTRPIPTRSTWAPGPDPAQPTPVPAGTSCRCRSSRKCLAGVPRTTNIVVDPRRSSTVWAGVEIDGVFRNDDGGDSWTKTADLGPSSLSGDIRPGRAGPQRGRPRRRRADLRHHAVRRLHQRRRGRHLGPPPVPRLLRGQQAGLLPLRDVQGRRHRHDVRGHRRHDPGEVGALQISRDGGESWAPAELPDTPYSVVYWLATHPERPDAVAAVSLYGQLYLSEDAGRSWTRSVARSGKPGRWPSPRAESGRDRLAGRPSG